MPQIALNTSLNLAINIKKSDLFSNLADFNIPLPQIVRTSNYTHTISFIIDGVFKTPKGIDFLNDIIARIYLAINEKIEIRSSINDFMDNKVKPYRLKDFQNLPSITKKNYTKRNPNIIYYEDEVFYTIKYHFEGMIERNFIDYQALESWACDMFLGKILHKRIKSYSDIKCKCRSIYRWYQQRDFKITKRNYVKKDKGEVMATRQEHMKEVNAKKVKTTQDKILSIINSTNAKDFLLENGNFNKSKIARELEIPLRTIQRHAPKLRELGIQI